MVQQRRQFQVKVLHSSTRRNSNICSRKIIHWKGTGVTVKRVDKNGTPVTAKYTPTVTPVTPTATPAESVAPQGVVQTGTVTFTEGDEVPQSKGYHYSS